MQQAIIDHYLKFSKFTYPGLYSEHIKDLPADIHQIGLLVRKSFIHRTTLEVGNTGTNSDLRFGDMTEVPWFQQAEDDNFPTAVSILAELWRRDSKGLNELRAVKDKMILTCRYVALIMVSILKSKGIPARVRSGFASYFSEFRDKSFDHWICEYYDLKDNKWIAVDVDGSLSVAHSEINPYDLKANDFDYSAPSWIGIRNRKIDERQFWNAMPYSGLNVVAWELFYDFHCLMNDEIIYLHHPSIVSIENFVRLDKKILTEIDELATLMQDPDKNFEELLKIWNTNKQFRLLNGALL